MKISFMGKLPVKFLTFALLLLCLSAPAVADEIDDFVTSQMQKRHIAGLSLAIIKDGNVIKRRGYGLASIELDVPATEESVYQIGSVTKSFTATAIMMLVEEGKLGLDDKVTRHLNGLPENWGGITIRHLLTHTSGLVTDPVPWSLETAARPYTPDEILQKIVNAPLQFPAGKNYSYNNSAFFLLALVVEKLSCKPYGEFLSERIFKPLGMTATRVNNPWDVVRNKANGYGWENESYNSPLLIHPSQTIGAGNLLSTVVDLAKFDVALAAGRLLKRSSLEQMWTPARLVNGDEVNYGLGWTIYNYRGQEVVGHGGNTPGFAAQLSHYVNDRTSIILLCNKTWGDDVPYKMSLRLATLIIPDLAIPTRPIEDTDPLITHKVRLLIEGIAGGKVDATLLSLRQQRTLSPDVIKVLKQLYEKEKGQLKSLSLLEKRMDGEDRVYMYKAIFEKEAVLYYIRVNRKGEIDRFETDPVDQ